MLAALLLRACSSAAPAIDPATAPEAAAGSTGPAPPDVPVEIALPEPAPEPVPSPSPPPLPPVTPACDGALVQGGLVICRAPPGTPISFGATRLVTDAGGTAQFGLAQKAPPELTVSGEGFALTLAIAPRSDAYREVPSFDCDKVDARTPAQKAHAARSWEIKQTAFKTLLDGDGALHGFFPPAAAPASSPFGPTRKYIGVSKETGQPCESTSVHQGYDLAAPVGTDVVAPASGIVTLADPDLYYEGGTVFLDHGHGLVSVFMHLSEVKVSAGERVARGALIARTGNTGRSTGPHLHWGVKWRNPASTDRSGDYYIDPALLLGLPRAE